jgi:hypothetical protein
MSLRKGNGNDTGNKQLIDIESLHQQACNSCKDSYIDPLTGYSVFTAYSHTKRGKCCGSGCRHCPFEYINVKDVSKRKELQHGMILRIQAVSAREKKKDDDDDSIRYENEKKGGEIKDTESIMTDISSVTAASLGSRTTLS